MNVDTGAFRWTLRNGTLVRVWREDRLLVDASTPGTWDGMADPRFTGIGSVGMHHLQPPWPGKARAFERARHRETLFVPGRTWGDGPYVRYHGVVEGLHVHTRWRFREGSATAVLLFALERPAWIKEPKVGVASFVGAPRAYVVRGPRGALLHRDDLSLSNPRKYTRQIKSPLRRHVELDFDGWQAHVTGGGLPLHGVPRVKLPDDANYGLGRVRYEAAKAPRTTSEGEGVPYCHCEALRPTWELVGWPDRSGILMHAWTGGTGFEDCACAYRLVQPFQVAYYLRVTFLSS